MTLPTLLSLCAEICAVPEADILSRSRKTEIVRARHLLFWALHQRGWNYSRIGKELGYDHTSVQHGIRQVHEIHRRYANQIWKRMNEAEAA